MGGAKRYLSSQGRWHRGDGFASLYPFYEDMKLLPRDAGIEGVCQQTSPQFEKRQGNRTIEATVFGKTRNGANHGRTPEDHTPTEDRGPQKQPHDNREEIIAKALVATGHARKRRARSETRRLQAVQREENRGIAQAVRRT
jgi:hypothetical protein